MQNFRAGLDAKGRRLASAGEACALFSALSCFVFVFLTGLRGGGGRSFLLWDCFAVRTAGGAFALCAALTALLSVCVLFALTVLRYVRFLLGKSKKDSLYFCYATFAAYLAGIMLFAMCAADGTYRLNGATVAGLCLGGAGTAASLVLFLTAKKEGGREAASRYTSGAFSLAAVLMLFALFSTGLVTDGDRRGLVWLYQGPSLPDGGTAAVLCFLFLIAFAACAVLLFERLLGGIAQRRKPTCLRSADGSLCLRRRPVRTVRRRSAGRNAADRRMGRSGGHHDPFRTHACCRLRGYILRAQGGRQYSAREKRIKFRKHLDNSP